MKDIQQNSTNNSFHLYFQKCEYKKSTGDLIVPNSTTCLDSGDRPLPKKFRTRYIQQLKQSDQLTPS